MFKKALFILMGLLLFVSFSYAGERVVTVGGNQATRPLTDFALATSGVGNTYYVDSVTGDDGRAGQSASTALATLNAAIGKCTANQGDVIYVLAGHTEALAGADGVDVDIAGVTIVGLGYGEDMPEFTYDAVDDEFVIGAANITVQGLRFVAGISDIVMGISVEAAGDNFTLKDCVFPKPSTNSFEFLDAIDIADGANYITIQNCEYYNDEGGAAANHFVEAGNGTAGPERLQVLDCYIKGDFAVSAIWSDEPCDEALIMGNTIINHTTGQHCIEFTDTGTGAIIGNNLYGDTEGAILDPGSMYLYRNRISVAIDLDGIPRWVLDNGLNHFLALDGATQVYPENAVDDSILAKMLSKSDPADISDYDNSTDSMEALADALAAILADTEAQDTNSEINVLWAHPRCVAKTDGAILTGDDPIFTITGGPVRAKIVGLVTTLVGGAATARLQIDVTTPAGTVELNAGAVAIDNDAAGTLYYNVGATSVFTPVTAGAVILDPVTVEEAEFILPIGTVMALCSAAQDGVIAWYMTYTPLSPNSVVVAAP